MNLLLLVTCVEIRFVKEAGFDQITAKFLYKNVSNWLNCLIVIMRGLIEILESWKDVIAAGNLTKPNYLLWLGPFLCPVLVPRKIF